MVLVEWKLDRRVPLEIGTSKNSVQNLSSGRLSSFGASQNSQKITRTTMVLVEWGTGRCVPSESAIQHAGHADIETQLN